MADTLIAFPKSGVSGGQTVPILAKDNGDGSYSIAVNGNAQVPASAPIQPPQAFVDAMGKYISTTGIGSPGLDMSSTGIVAFDGNTILGSLTGDSIVINLSGNAFNVASVNGTLAALVASGQVTNSTIQLNGGTMAAPTGQGLLDKATLILAGNEVDTN